MGGVHGEALHWECLVSGGRAESRSCFWIIEGSLDVKCAAVDQQTAQEAGTPPDLHVMGTRKRPRDAGGAKARNSPSFNVGKKI